MRLSTNGQNLFKATIGICLLLAFVPPVSATSITIFGPNETTVELAPAGPITVPGLGLVNSYVLNLAQLFPLAFPSQTSLNVLPGGLFAENETGVSLALINFGVHMETLPFKKYDPVIAFQTFGFLVEGDFWKVKMIIDYDLTRSGQPFPFDRSDVLDISGFVQHIFTPHSGDSDIGPELPYFVVISAVEEFPSEPGIARGGQILAGAHPSVGHDDFGVALLSGKIMANASRREFDFESWVGGVIVRHTIPQPSTAVLFGSGLLAFAGMAWKRCRRTRPSS